MNWIIILVWALGGILIFIVSWVIYCVLSPTGFDRIRGNLYLFLSPIRKKWRQEAIVIETQNKINEYLLKSGLEGIGLPLAKVELVKPEEVQTLIENNEIILKLAPRRKASQNIVSTVLTYVSKGIIPGVKPYLGEDLTKSIDLTLTELILTRTANVNAVRTFSRKVLLPAFRSDPRLKKLNDTLKRMDTRGWFTRVLLREYAYWTIKMWPTIETEEMITEAKKFLDFLYPIATKEHGEDVELTFQEKLINMSVVLVAKGDKYFEKGVYPYLKAIEINIRNGVETIYAMAIAKNIDIARYIAFCASRRKLVKIVSKQDYTIRYIDKGGVPRTQPAICIVLEPAGDN